MSRICRFCSHPCVTFLHLLCERAGTSLSSQESCTSRLFLGHREHTGSQQRKLGTTIHAPLNDAAVGSHALQEGPGRHRQRESCKHRSLVAVRIPLANDFNSGTWLRSAEVSQLSRCCPVCSRTICMNPCVNPYAATALGLACL